MGERGQWPAALKVSGSRSLRGTPPPGTSRKNATAFARSGTPMRAQASFPDRNGAITESPLIRGLVVPMLFRDSPRIGARTDCPGHHQLVRKPS